MSCKLEFISVDLETIKDFFANGDAGASKTLIAKGAEIYDGDDEDEETQEDRLVWREIIQSLNGGSLGKYLAGQKPFGETSERNDLISEMKARALACILRHFGKSIAGVFHSINAGETFCTDPFEYINQSGFLNRTDSFLVLERPFFNQLSVSLPGFGGLTRTELAGISLDNMNAVIDSDDSDVDAWVDGILTLVEEAKRHELDLVTIYE
jgi:hypothetical protein